MITFFALYEISRNLDHNELSIQSIFFNIALNSKLYFCFFKCNKFARWSFKILNYKFNAFLLFHCKMFKIWKRVEILDWFHTLKKRVSLWQKKKISYVCNSLVIFKYFRQPFYCTFLKPVLLENIKIRHVLIFKSLKIIRNFK